jgi:DNA invertase Pin-like site-specific DNA recombinase
MENSTPHKTIAYLRVSTFQQNTEKNKADILHFANQHDLGRVHFVEVVVREKRLGGNV